ncbi:MAG: alpha-hydroxy-acid oxidizing protein [Desulfobacterales bacterium]|nr:alpha-hydroxy-acid oxidizing protein [Desulfobacterales bacterium]
MMKTIRTTARERMAGFCRVCPVCDGRACAGQVPGMGGLGTGSGFRANLAALAEWRLNMRVLHEASEPDPATRVLDIDLAMPVMAAPIGGVAFNMGGAVSEEDYIASKLKACQAGGIIGCTGDGVPTFIHEAGFAAIAELGGHGIPFIKPWEDAELDTKLDKALATGTRVVGMDVDAAGLVTLRQMGRPVSPKSPDQIREIIARTPARFILKGIMTADQARLAVDAGAAAIVVSNHGGRVLDHTPGAAEVLPEIADAVSGQVTVLADGGIRSGADVLKMVALGADAVMIGRPFSVATVGGLEDGVRTYIDQIRTELISAMVLTGCRDLAAVGRHVLRPQAPKF